MDLVHDEKWDLWIRPDTHDLAQARENRKLMEMLDPQPTDTVLDVGAFIGTIARPCLTAGSTVTAVEPDPESLIVLKKNCPDATILECALTDDPVILAQSAAAFYRNVGGREALNTLLPVKGRPTVEVPVRSFHEVLTEVDPTILKVDIEGGEWMLDFEDLPTRIRFLHIEMHLPAVKRRACKEVWNPLNVFEKGPALHRSLLKQGFKCLVEPNFDAMWGTHPIYTRV